MPEKSPEKRDYLTLWAQLGQIRPDPNLPRVADTYVNKLVREQMAADGSGRLTAAVASFEKARALVDATFKWFRERQAPRVVLLSAWQNPDAHAFFEALGFRRTMLEMTAELDA
jgi:GNAT superfamily N-acetyltransferase